ncbi:MAG: bifunctional UDP-N-acetylglucosamine diphosphorylase/glucosamine-1-phosphate N-acetyltransferase GlmU, partial [Clostridia bacterium]|nr:bifunctional UDP-N-acetylglucosamine diphosphorylase/glucosamine-1-phosphate N-acetyltransferase GlmU [Clostridia bacterium]
PLVKWVIEATSDAEKQVVIVGHCAEQVKEYLGDSVEFAEQKELLGTGHAVMQARKFLEGYDGDVAIMTGDTPLITKETIRTAYGYHIKEGNSVTVLTAKIDNPFGYGRIVRDEQGNVKKIVEQKDATEEEAKITEINSGMYFFNAKDLLSALDMINNNNAQKEYYLTDTLEILINNGKKVGAFVVENPSEILGINDRAQLAEAQKIMQERIIKKHFSNGVTFLSPETCFISEETEIGKDTVIMPGTIIKGATKIGENCVIGPNAQITDSEIADFVEINSSVMLESFVDEHTKVGPFAYIRPNSKIGKNIKIGDFVEIKNATIDDGTKVSHLTYVGDADVGKKVNFGCGTVLVNYDGKNKFRSVIEDNAFIGCNTNLVSPVKVEKNAFIAAGSTITDNVPGDTLAIARARQIIKTGWKDKRK